MITVTAVRTVTRPQYQRIERTVQLHGFDKLTPRAARAAQEIAFGGSSEGEVWWTRPMTSADDTPEMDTYGYRLYAKTARKVKPF